MALDKDAIIDVMEQAGFGDNWEDVSQWLISAAEVLTALAPIHLLHDGKQMLAVADKLREEAAR